MKTRLDILEGEAQREARANVAAFFSILSEWRATARAVAATCSVYASTDSSTLDQGPVVTSTVTTMGTTPNIADVVVTPRGERKARRADHTPRMERTQTQTRGRKTPSKLSISESRAKGDG